MDMNQAYRNNMTFRYQPNSLLEVTAFPSKHVKFRESMLPKSLEKGVPKGKTRFNVSYVGANQRDLNRRDNGTENLRPIDISIRPKGPQKETPDSRLPFHELIIQTQSSAPLGQAKPPAKAETDKE